MLLATGKGYNILETQSIFSPVYF